MTSGETLDASYRTLTASLPPHLQGLAEDLPFKLGITRSPRGGWGDFVGLHPNRELPVYAAQDAVAAAGGRGGGGDEDGDSDAWRIGDVVGGGSEGGEDGDTLGGLGAGDGGGICLPPARLRLFLMAHHLGGFHFLLRDRLEDRQAEAGLAGDGRVPELSEQLGARWLEALGAATGDGALAHALVRHGDERWRRGTAAERRALGEKEPLSPRRYAALVRDKLAWIGVPSRALIIACGRATRLAAFLRAHDLFLLGLQVIDDVIDRAEDRALRGGDVPTALGCSPGALLRAAPKLAGRAAAVAAAAGFTWFSSWLEAFQPAIASFNVEGDPLGDELVSIGLAGEMEEEVAGPG